MNSSPLKNGGRDDPFLLRPVKFFRDELLNFQEIQPQQKNNKKNFEKSCLEVGSAATSVLEPGNILGFPLAVESNLKSKKSTSELQMSFIDSLTIISIEILWIV